MAAPSNQTTTEQTLTGIDALAWLASKGAAFCKVAAWNASIESPGKAPVGRGWQNTPLTVRLVQKHLTEGGNVGMLTGKNGGGLCMIDLDQGFGEFLAYFPILQHAPRIIRDNAPDRGKIIIRIAGELPGSKKINQPGSTEGMLEWLATGRQGVIAGKHSTGAALQLVIAQDEIPTYDAKTVSDWCAIWTGRGLEENETHQAPAAIPTQTTSNSRPESDGLRDAVAARWSTLEVFKHFGKVKETRLEARGEWLRILGNGGLFIHCEAGSPGNGWKCMSDEQKGDQFDAWQYCRHNNTNTPKDARFADLLREMAEAGGLAIPEHKAARELQEPDFDEWQPTDDQAPAEELPTTSPAAAGQPAAEPPNYGPILLTELGNSRRFSTAYHNQALHVKAWGWLVWNGQKWEVDETGRAKTLAKRIIDQLYTEAQEALSDAQKVADLAKTATETDQEVIKVSFEAAQKRAKELLRWAMQSQTEQKIGAMLALAEDDLPARVDDFDSNPWVLNCSNGMLDLKTGRLQPHNSSERITKTSGAAYDPAAQCPLWLASLNTWFDGNQELITFIRRAMGMTLTGMTSEQVMFFLYGTGKNGKSVFSEVLQALLNDYARRTPTDTLMLKRLDEGVPNDIARLPGARAVIAAELAEGKRLNESLVKDLTGGDRITARFLRKEFFEFNPTFKLWMYGNHKPTIRGTDEGIWRRVRLIPFTVTIPEGQRDPQLVDKLKAELPGILAWAVQGCLEWQREGLGMPEAVKAATANYRAEQDMLAAFLDECCLIGPRYKVCLLYTSDAADE